MKKSLIVSVVVLVAATALLLVGAFSVLNGNGNESSDASAASSATSGEAGEDSIVPEPAEMSDRPNCPSTGAGGVELPCLGGDNGAAPDDPNHITVVNVWAWWCGPCRDELPIVEQYAEQNPGYTVVGVQADTNAGYGADLLTELNVDIASYQDSDNLFAGTLGLPNVIPITVVFRGEEQIGLFPQAFTSVDEMDEAVSSVV
ncbi:TlpA family protein disulfide reductase [Corynebacterium lubricantis]|uniref:TlpA family protein disulfide reductase n=1 Tax=Corynebacterium lubricantis TaxID=541095 RepID=UPI00037067C3|nr:TlpA disulfide reductase family protein [Corynebacterium lubricantis]